MKFSWPVYIALAVVALASFAGAWLLPTTEFMHGIAASPAIVALISVVYQIFRDHATYEKTLALQRDQQHFTLGITSQMATVVFNKHVAFCEKYIERMQKGLSELFFEGATEKCIAFATDLEDIRFSYRAWLTAEIQEKILPFEETLRKIGGGSYSLEHLPLGDKRDRIVEEIEELFNKILDLQTRGEGAEKKIAATIFMDHLQDLLGVKQLVQLRIKLVDEAVKTLERKG